MTEVKDFLRRKNTFSQVLFITLILLVTIILIPPTSSLGVIDDDDDADLGRDAGDTKGTADELMIIVLISDSKARDEALNQLLTKLASK